MKHQSKLLLTLLHGVGVGTIAMTGSSLVSTDAVAGISNTKHNLTLSTNANRITGGATAEVCVFCHTPHGADTSTTNAPPLWNKKLNSSGGYTTYAQLGTSSLDAANNNGSLATGSISLACLSCHDGTQAMDNIINSPGSDGYDSTGGDAAGMTGTGWAWSTSSGRVTSAGNLAASIITNLGQDLRNDHPIGVQYCGGFSAAPVSGTNDNCRDGDFNAIKFTGSGSSAQYYVDQNGSGNRDKSDMVLYTRDFGSSTFRPSVECGSCHDPHVESKATNETAFLRISQASSNLCLACHNK